MWRWRVLTGSALGSMFTLILWAVGLSWPCSFCSISSRPPGLVAYFAAISKARERTLAGQRRLVVRRRRRAVSLTCARTDLSRWLCIVCPTPLGCHRQTSEVYANPLQLGSSPQRVTYTERAGLWQSRSPHASASLDTSELKPGSHKGTCALGGSTPLTGAILPGDEFNLAGIAFAKGLPGPKRMGDATASREQ